MLDFLKVHKPGLDTIHDNRLAFVDFLKPAHDFQNSIGTIFHHVHEIRRIFVILPIFIQCLKSRGLERLKLMFVAEDIHFEAIVNADLLDEGGHQPFLELEKKRKISVKSKYI